MGSCLTGRPLLTPCSHPPLSPNYPWVSSALQRTKSMTCKKRGISALCRCFELLELPQLLLCLKVALLLRHAQLFTFLERSTEGGEVLCRGLLYSLFKGLPLCFPFRLCFVSSRLPSSSCCCSCCINTTDLTGWRLSLLLITKTIAAAATCTNACKGQLLLLLCNPCRL